VKPMNPILPFCRASTAASIVPSKIRAGSSSCAILWNLSRFAEGTPHDLFAFALVVAPRVVQEINSFIDGGTDDTNSEFWVAHSAKGVSAYTQDRHRDSRRAKDAGRNAVYALLSFHVITSCFWQRQGPWLMRHHLPRHHPDGVPFHGNSLDSLSSSGLCCRGKQSARVLATDEASALPARSCSVTPQALEHTPQPCHRYNAVDDGILHDHHGLSRQYNLYVVTTFLLAAACRNGKQATVGFSNFRDHTSVRHAFLNTIISLLSLVPQHRLYLLAKLWGVLMPMIVDRMPNGNR